MGFGFDDEAAFEEREQSFSNSKAQKCRINLDQSAAWPFFLAAHAPTPSFAPMKFCSTSTASSPFVMPLIVSPLIDGLLSLLRLCVLRGSEKDPEGGERNGGGKGRDGRLAKRA